ncbi:amino acid ABC transporter substrate-binding protein [Actinobacillus succinogenes]|uniref:Extracellular solute-binding protein family 3 n=1 Tax=Actinobacillus succinogenes (strain ATCC 55618 / DSM 22257 / CCUG 43843 / 130Z) TaxID=339671 RepID=A6VL29_ACTSZ|nr:amino acid ABC transporter substrate-binding protein [Actinobacillus succinogenes]ABR73676.1 extracellular solute-binding protein family 3 [Actinobacillus succinogenes 130Z]PHI39865.1 amino acid ABC transporter substrate-binding protein [Actinobacillus succinogenes]
MFKKLTLLAASALALATATQVAAADSLLDRINNKGTISVGTEGTYAPFTYHDASGKLTGYDVEVTRAVAEKLGVKVDFKETVWDSMMAGLKAGRFDMVANQVALTTPERRAIFDKSEAYSWSGAMMAVRADDDSIKTLEDIKGRKAAQSLTSNYGELAREKQAQIVPVDGLAQSLLVVQQKRADLTLNDSLAILDYLKKNPNAGLKTPWEAPAEEKLGSGLIVNKGNDEALAKISAAIVELQQDGTLKKLGEQFFGKDISVK